MFLFYSTGLALHGNYPAIALCQYNFWKSVHNNKKMNYATKALMHPPGYFQYLMLMYEYDPYIHSCSAR